MMKIDIPMMIFGQTINNFSKWTFGTALDQIRCVNHYINTNDIDQPSLPTYERPTGKKKE